MAGAEDTTQTPFTTAIINCFFTIAHCFYKIRYQALIFPGRQCQRCIGVLSSGTNGPLDGSKLISKNSLGKLKCLARSPQRQHVVLNIGFDITLQGKVSQPVDQQNRGGIIFIEPTYGLVISSSFRGVSGTSKSVRRPYTKAWTK